MSDMYKRTYRGYLIDHHSPDPPIVTLENLSIDEYEIFFKEAHINNLMVYCKDHWGASYYDTKIGRMHPGLKEDWLAKIKPVLQRNHIEFNAYYCLEYDNYAPTIHPEWRILKADGAPLTCAYSKAQWKMPCYETGYRNYVLGQLAEIVEEYRPDSLFLDIFGKSLCYCPVCLKKFQRAYGYALPREEEALKEANKDVTAFLDDCAKCMLQDIKDTVKTIDPEIKITINFAALYNIEIRDMLDYQFTEPWAGNWLSAAYARDTAIGQYPQLGPGDVSEVYNYQPQSIYTLAAAQIAAQGCRVFIYSGSQHPDGTLEHEEARRVGKAYTEVEKFETYLDNREAIADIGIIQSDLAERIKTDEGVAPNAIARVKKGSSHRSALLGAMKLCDHAQYAWHVVPEQALSEKNIFGYKMLILPEVYHINKKLQALLEGFVKQGGVLMASGETGCYDADGNRRTDFTLKDLYGAGYVDTVDKYSQSDWGSYLDRMKSPLWKYLPTTMPPVDSVRYAVDNQSAEVLAGFINPATELTPEKWVNWWCPPPAEKTGEPAVLLNRYGTGQVLFTAFNLFGMANKAFTGSRISSREQERH